MALAHDEMGKRDASYDRRAVDILAAGHAGLSCRAMIFPRWRRFGDGRRRRPLIFQTRDGRLQQRLYGPVKQIFTLIASGRAVEVSRYCENIRIRCLRSHAIRRAEFGFLASCAPPLFEASTRQNKALKLERVVIDASGLPAPDDIMNYHLVYFDFRWSYRFDSYLLFC